MMKPILSHTFLQVSLAFISASGALAASKDSDSAHDAAASGGLPQLDPTWFASQIFWLVLIFSILYIIFSKSILPALSSTIERRREHIDSDLDTARQMKDEAEKVHRAYEESLSEARNKSSDLFAKAEQKIKDNMTKEMNALRDKSMSAIQDAEASILKQKKAAMKDMDLIAADLAAQATEKIIGVSADEKKLKAIISNISKEAA